MLASISQLSEQIPMRSRAHPVLVWLKVQERNYVAARDQLTVADLTNRKTDQAGHNGRALEMILSEFRLARETLLKRVDKLDSSLFARPIPHPRLNKPIRLGDHENPVQHAEGIRKVRPPPGGIRASSGTTRTPSLTALFQGQISITDHHETKF